MLVGQQIHLSHSRMQLPHLTPNPRFAAFKATLTKNPGLFQPWQGTFFRFQSISFPAPGEVLSGEGARRRGGRWNPPGQAALYGSLTDTVALEECKANDRYYGVETKGPRLLIAIEAVLTGLVDLTSSTVRRTLGLTLQELAHEDWRMLQHAGKESSSQALGRAAAACGASGLLARSTALHGTTNLAVFPKARQHDRLRIVGEKELGKLGIKSRA